MKRTCIILLVVSILLALTACGETTQLPSGTIVSTAATESNDNPYQNGDSSQESSFIPETMHILESFSDNLLIDSDVVGCPIDGTLGIYSAEPKDFTKGEINTFISSLGESIISTNEWDDGAMAYYNGECTNGYRFGYMWGLDGLNNHPYAEFKFYDTNRYMTYYNYPIYSGGEENYITNSKYTVGWMFTEPKEFSFATEEEAKVSVQNSLATLGMNNLYLLRTLYIDHNTLAKAGELLATNENYAPIGEPLENNGYHLRDDWSEEDDAYMFSFGISVAGTPMSYFFDDSEETATYCGSEVNVWYTKFGITFLRVSTPWTVGEAESSVEPIISAETALEVAKEKYIYDLNMKNKKIEEIRLLYKYKQNKNHWFLQPTWTVRVSYQYEQSDERYYQFMYIDALTGKEL